MYRLVSKGATRAIVVRVLVHVSRDVTRFIEPIKSNGSSKIPVFYYSLLPRWTAQSRIRPEKACMRVFTLC